MTVMPAMSAGVPVGAAARHAPGARTSPCVTGAPAGILVG
jgi:hypothetical protein